MDEPVTLFYGSRQLNQFTLAPEDTHHAVRVLRHGRGDLIWCLDGSGTLFQVRLEQTGVRNACGQIVAERRDPHEPPCDVILLCGMTLPSRLDWLVEKATELGVTSIRLLTDRRRVGPGRLMRLARIARAAAKQCRRAWIPDVQTADTLGDMLDALPKCALKLLADPAGTPLSDQADLDGAVILAVGPDSGFEDHQIETLEREGFQRVGLGARRLRTETAAISLLARVADRFNSPAQRSSPVSPVDEIA